MTRQRLRAANDIALLPNPDRSAAWLHVARQRDPSLADSRAAMLAALLRQADSLERTCRPGHFTGSALVVDDPAERVLLLFHTKLQRWLQPGGHADGDGNLASVALREAREETGIEGLRLALPAIDLDIHQVDPPREDAHLHLDVRFLVVAPPGAAPVGNHESEALRWVPVGDLSAYDLDPGTHRMIASGIALAHRLG